MSVYKCLDAIDKELESLNQKYEFIKVELKKLEEDLLMNPDERFDKMVALLNKLEVPLV